MYSKKLNSTFDDYQHTQIENNIHILATVDSTFFTFSSNLWIHTGVIPEWVLIMHFRYLDIQFPIYVC